VVRPITDEEWNEVLRLFSNDKRIEAIKVYRRYTGASLRESKDAVDIMARKAGLRGFGE
jgi:ribosomal protein L7/L12